GARAMIRLPLAAPALGDDVTAALRDADVPDESIHLAGEAAGWAAGLSPDERQAFALVVVALLDARAAGSTRLELAALPRRLAGLGVPGPGVDAAATLAAALPALDARAPLAALVGRPGDYRPFIVRGGFLHAERDFVLEQRLGAALGARLAGPDAAADAR